MTRSELPQGVPPSNNLSAENRSADEKPRFKAPDMASPGFLSAASAAPRPNAAGGQESFVAQTADEAISHGKGGRANGALKILPGPMFIMIVLAGLLAALAAIIVANTRSTMPLCSDQPSWNQHNCRQS